MDQWLVFAYFVVGSGLVIPAIAVLTGPIKRKMAQAERREARALYREIVADKLDVIKTAIAMGYSGDELRELDARLEQLISREELAGLLDGMNAPEVPQVDPDSELMDVDLVGEIEREKARRRQRTRDSQ